MSVILGCRTLLEATHGVHHLQHISRQTATDVCGRRATCTSCARGADCNATSAADIVSDVPWIAALSEERQEAMKTAAMCERRHCRLTFKAEQIKEAAVKAVQAGNDRDARRLLEVKAKVLESAAASLRRAHINRALATKLEKVMQASGD